MPSATFSVKEGRIEFYSSSPQPFGASVLYKIDGKEQPLGIRFDLTKQARLDHLPDPDLDEIASRLETVVMKKLSQLQELVVELYEEEASLLRTLESLVRRKQMKFDTILGALDAVREQRKEPINMDDPENIEYLEKRRDFHDLEMKNRFYRAISRSV